MITLLADAIKYLTLLVSVLYTFMKLTGMHPKKVDLFYIALLPAFAVGLHYVDFYVKMLVPITILVFYIAVFKLRYIKMPFGDVINMATISVGISVFFMLIGFVISLPLILPLFGVGNEELRALIAQIPLCAFMLLMTFLLFKIKRFKSAITPLKKDGTYDALTFGGIVSIFAMTVYYISRYAVIGIVEMSFLFLAFSALTLIIGWRRVITQRYRQDVLRRNVEHLNRELETNNEQVTELSKKNEELANIIHRDNKLIPSMMLALEECLKNYDKERAAELHAELKELYAERAMAVENFAENAGTLKKTGDLMVDSIMQFLSNSAAKRAVEFSFDFEEQAVKALRQVFCEGNELNTLLCDLGENAIIAAQGGGKVKLLLDCPADMPQIRIFDSGAQFDEKVLALAGKKKITTHIESGGSGTGLFSTFEILSAHSASFVIDEKVAGGFSKCVSIVPDGKNRRCVYTSRKAVKQLCGERKTFTVIDENTQN